MASTNLVIENYVPVVMQAGLNTNKASYLAGLAVDASGNLAVTGTTNLAGITVDASGNASFPGTVAFTSAPTGPKYRPTSTSAAVGATVVLTAAQSGSVLINASTSGSPSWTLPTAADGLWFTFETANVTAGFTVTGGTIKCKTTASGTALSGTTLTNTQGTAIVGDTITLVCDGTSWRMVAQSGIFACA